MPQIRHIGSNTLTDVELSPVFRGGVWECGDQRFTDPGKTLYEAVISIVPVTVSVTEFMLLFTVAERVKTRELRATNASINDFWLLLEHPKTENVVMALPSVQRAVDYTLTAIKAAGLPALDVAARKAEILAGTLQ